MTRFGLLCLVFALVACRSPEAPPEPRIPPESAAPSEADGESENGTPDSANDDASAGAAAEDAEEAANFPEGVTSEQIEQGRRLYSGLGRCQACHGFGGRGSTQGPPVNGRAPWLHSDGSYESLVEVIRDGVPKPRRYMMPMPPAGGAPLTDEHIRAVAAYIWSISHSETAGQ